MQQKQLNFDDLPKAVGLLLEKMEKVESMLATKDDSDYGSRKEDVVKISEATKILGLTKSSIYQKTSKGEIPFIKLNNSTHIRFSRRDLNEWMSSGRRQAA